MSVSRARPFPKDITVYEFSPIFAFPKARKRSKVDLSCSSSFLLFGRLLASFEKPGEFNRATYRSFFLIQTFPNTSQEYLRLRCSLALFKFFFFKDRFLFFLPLTLLGPDQRC